MAGSQRSLNEPELGSELDRRRPVPGTSVAAEKSVVPNGAVTALARGGGSVDPSVAANIQRAVSGGGQPLPEEVRVNYEEFFDTDLGGVRIHADAEADQLARDVQAAAFTTGQDLFFRAGHFRPSTQAGQHLLAHELAHVDPGAAGVHPKGLEVAPADSPEEQRAERLADEFVARTTATATAPTSHAATGRGGGTPTLHRSILDDLVEGAEKLWSGVKEWVADIVDKSELRNEITKLLAATPISASALVKLFKRSDKDIRRSLYLDSDVRRSIIGVVEGEDRVRVLSAMLAGQPYSRGWQTDLYDAMSPDEQDEINEQTDRSFARETGIERALDGGSSVDKVLVRRWLRLRDEAIETGIAREEHEREKVETATERYEHFLKQGIKQMNDVKFGSALDKGVIQDVDFEYWDLKTDEEFAKEPGRENQGKLVANGTAPYPAMAVDELFSPANLKKWVLDCAEFTQAAHLYARRHSLGAQEFTSFVESGGSKLDLRMHYSSGYKTKTMFQRSSPTEPMQMLQPDGTKVAVAASAEELLERAPVGCRIVWRNLQASPSSDFFNENATKLGDDDFAARGFTGKSTFTKDELERALAEITHDAATDGPIEAYIEENVFIRTIEEIHIPVPKGPEAR